MKNKRSKKQLIIDFLMDDGISSTNKVSHAIKANYHQTLAYLDELIKEKKIKKLKSPCANYWDIRGKK